MIRHIPFEGPLNFRDIGGYPVTGGGITRWRAVYRSDSLHRLTEGDLLAFDALGVKAIYDLRRPSELSRFPGPRAYVHLEIAGGDIAKAVVAGLRTRRDGQEWLAADYLSMLTAAAPAFGTLLSRLADGGQLPAVVHCLGGKDRTGLAIALLLTALGVDRDTVLDDYELTSQYYAARVPEVVDAFAALGIARPAGEGLLSTPRWTMAQALQELDRAYDGIEPYLLGPAGLPPGALRALRASLTG